MRKVLGALFCLAVGTWTNAQTLNATSVIFADPSLGVNSDNTVLYRSDITNDFTRLRLQLGDEESALFEVGYPYYSNGQWTNLFTLDGSGNGFFKGNVGLGAPASIWFGGSTRVFEIAYNRPVFKLNSTASNDLSTIVFTNVAISSTTRHGEFHINHQYDAANAANSALRFGTYPAGEVFTVLSNGNIGMGLVAPLHKLDVGGTLRTSDYILGNQYISVTKGGSYRVSMNGQAHGYITGRNDSNQEKFLINTNGNSFFNGGSVGIGTMSPDQALTVKGKVHAEEVIIDLSVPAPDYVFEGNYSLTPLDTVQAYIAQHKHLPELPSAKEMEKDGVKVGEMEMILLKKIEELTLYIIESNKQIKALQDENAAQKSDIKKMSARIESLK
ncbi:MAG TPA: hypothetical protein VGD65_25750 [Chryseosolibacter sp.]